MRLVSIAGFSALLTFATPALAQVTYAPEASVLVAPAVVVTPRPVVAERILVRRTRFVRRTVLVPRTRYVRRTLTVPVTRYVTRARYAAVPLVPAAVVYPVRAYPPVYPDTGLTGPVWVPPGTSYPCVLGTVGCDSSVVGPLDF